ncbi:hypothetical protein GMSM_29000 [Geomonas sp. Red276]
MQIYQLDIEYYETEKGQRPFKAWLEALADVAGRAKMRVRLDRARLGNLGDHKYIGHGVWEMRIDYGPGYRIYFAREGYSLILLPAGGEKSSQSKDIKLAQKCWVDYLWRKKNGETDKLPG